jgi:hypothetical protein
MVPNWGGDKNSAIITSKGLSKYIKLPGDISERAKQDGIGAPWQKVMGSEISLMVAILIPVVAIILGKYSILRRTKLKK